MKELTLKELQTFCLEMMQDIHNFCVQNNIKYSLYAGSMLGAIRHKGFIPWDDDLDIIMPRPDYDRFCHEYQSRHYEIMCHENTEDYYLAFARVYDQKKTTYTTLSPWTKKDAGCWIDIFPADGFPSDEREQYAHYSNCISLRSRCIFLRHVKACFNGSLLHRIRLLFEKIVTINGLGLTKYVNELCETATKYEYGKMPYWASLTNVRSHKEWKHHPINTFEKCHLTKFENCEFFIADGYDIILTQRFGDYMQLPPKEEQVPKQGYIHFYWR